MDDDYEIKIKIGNMFLARRFSVAKDTINQTKYWFLGWNIDKEACYKELLKFKETIKKVGEK